MGSSTSARAELAKQVESAVAQDQLEAALKLMCQEREWQDAACILQWRFGWAAQHKLSGQMAQRQYNTWCTDVFTPHLLNVLNGKSLGSDDSLAVNEQSLTRLLCNVKRYVTIVKNLGNAAAAALPTPLRLEQESVKPGFRRIEPAPPPAARDEIKEVYLWTKGSMLLLGETGSGKTYRLMEIAEELLAVLCDDPTAVIPLPLDLADWQLSDVPFADWVVEAANRSYLIERETCRAWLAERRFALLLDSLNSIVSVENRTACVVAINRFLEQVDPPGLVVCCLPREYDEMRTPLALEAAVHVEPLDISDIQAFLIKDQTLAPELRTMLLEDSELAQLCDTPLGFGIVQDAFAAGALTAGNGAAALPTAERRQRLLDIYIDRVLDNAYATASVKEQAQARHWLGWLGLRMTEHQMNLLWFERIQPSWLPKGGWQIGYYAITRIVFGAVAGVLGGIMIGVALGFSGTNFLRGIMEGLTAALAGGIMMAALDSRWQNRFGRIEHQWLRSLLNLAVIFCVVAAAAFAVFMIVLSPLWCSTIAAGRHYCVLDSNEGLSVASLAGLSFALVFGIESKEGPRSVQNDIQSGVVERLDLSHVRARRFGLAGLGLGTATGLIMLAIYLREGHAGNPVLMIAEQLHQLVAQTVPIVLLIPLYIAVVCGAIGATFGAITGMAIFPKSRTRPDQPIWLLLKNAAMIGSVAALLCVAVFWTIGAVASLPGVWTYGVFVGFLVFLGYGGLSLFLYVCLRWLLSLRRETPPITRYTPFLAAMSELRLLYPVLGGYRFFHPLWQEHFARTHKAAGSGPIPPQ